MKHWWYGIICDDCHAPLTTILIGFPYMTKNVLLHYEEDNKTFCPACWNQKSPQQMFKKGIIR